MHYLGGIKCGAVCPASINAIEDLLHHCVNVRKTFPGCSVLINSSSWLLDIGHGQLSNLISMMRLSDIVYFDSSGSLKHREVLTRSMGNKCHLWGLASKAYRSAPASTIQWNRMQSYLHIAPSSDDRHYWDPLALLSFNKKELSYSGPASMIWAVVTLGERLAADNLAQALEDSMVAIVVVQKDGCEAQNDQLLDDRPEDLPGDLAPDGQITPDRQQGDPAEIARTAGENLPYFLDSDIEATFLHPRRSDCLGLAYITAIDAERETLKVVTPISLQIMSARREHGLGLVIVMGQQDLSWASVHG
jgi:polynucleotide 5'-hydroxyl-kinase GRC3/NOL9